MKKQTIERNIKNQMYQEGFKQKHKRKIWHFTEIKEKKLYERILPKNQTNEI